MIPGSKKIFTRIVSVFSRGPSDQPVALCYHGYLRIATGLSLLQGMTELNARAEDINVRELLACVHSSMRLAIRLVHGSSDRVTSPAGTGMLFNRLPHPDKEFEIFEGYEHGRSRGSFLPSSWGIVMIKVGIDAADDEKRQRVLTDWRAWLLKRC